MSETVVECINVHRQFSGTENVPVLNGIEFTVRSGDAVAIEGASGSGKSTLLHILAGLDQPSEGSLYLFGQALTEMKSADLLRLRNELVGMIYQFHHLLPEFSIAENVAMPLLIRGVSKAKAIAVAHRFITRVGLIDRASHRPSQLSGGECQRAAIARALVIEPRLVLADEPTGNLDSANAQIVSDLLLELCEDTSASVIVATHDGIISAKMNKTFTLREGKLTLTT